MSLVVGSLAVAHHGHDVGKRSAGTVVLVRIEEDTQTLEVVRRTEDRTLSGALLGEPHGETIAVQVAGPFDLEFNLDLNIYQNHPNPRESASTNLPVRRGQRHTGEDPSLLRRAIGRKTDVSRKSFSISSLPIPATHKQSEHTCRRELSCHHQNRTSGFGSRNPSMAAKILT